jgi:hypothetical protein
MAAYTKYMGKLLTILCSAVSVSFVNRFSSVTEENPLRDAKLQTALRKICILQAEVHFPSHFNDSAILVL